MNLKTFGLIVGIVGIVFMIAAVIIGAVIGVNSVTETKYYDDDEDISQEDKNKAEESTAFLMDFNTGVTGTGIGFILVGAGLVFARNKKNNTIVMGLSILTILLLIIGLCLSAYAGMLSSESTSLYNKDDMSDSDYERVNEIGETQAFLSPFTYFFSSFLFGGFTIGLAFFVILLGAFLKDKDDGPMQSLAGSSGFGTGPKPAGTKSDFDIYKKDNEFDDLFNSSGGI